MDWRAAAALGKRRRRPLSDLEQGAAALQGITPVCTREEAANQKAVAAERTACLRSSSRRSRSDTMAAEGSRQTVKHAKAVPLATMNHGPPAFHPAWKPAFIPCKHDCSLPVMEPARLPSCLFYSC